MNDGVQTARSWKIDPFPSQVEFAVKHMMVTTVKGSFTRFDGSIVLDEQRIENSTVSVVIDATSLDTRDAKRDTHLRSADFFDVAQHSVITFVSGGIEQAGHNLRVTGDLTLKGITKPVVLDAEIEGPSMSQFGVEVMGFSGQTKINRKAFGITWNAPLESGGLLVSEEVTVALDIQAVATHQDVSRRS